MNAFIELVREERLLVLFERASIVAPVTPFEAYVLVLQNYVEQRMLTDFGARIGRILEEAGYRLYK